MTYTVAYTRKGRSIRAPSHRRRRRAPRGKTHAFDGGQWGEEGGKSMCSRPLAMETIRITDGSWGEVRHLVDCQQCQRAMEGL